jgi:WD40 repeat protein
MGRYNAFISYSHGADRGLAAALEHGLKRFAKPWYQRQALRIFRDQTDLSAAPQLWTLIKQALDDSEFLILLASPGAAKSPWVDRELAYWLESKGPQSLLIVLTDGTLTWDAGRGAFDPLTTDALPARLLDAFAEEPLYVDLRWAQDASSLSLHDPRFLNQIADLAAPLHGKPKAELASTEVREHKRTLRIAWSAGIALFVLAVAAGGLALLAETQRQVANARQHEAEITLARSDFVQGVQHVESDEAGMAIPRLGRSLVLEPARPATATRLVSLLTQRWLPRMLSEGPTLPDAIRFLVYSKSGRLLAAASAGELQVWDVAAGKPLMPPVKDDLPVTHVEFSPDERWLLSSTGTPGFGSHGHLRLWDLQAPEAPLHQIDVDGMLWTAKFAPDGKSIATASAFAIEFWSVPDGERLPHTIDFRDFAKDVPGLTRMDNAFADVAFAAEGSELVIVSSSLGASAIARWSLADNELKAIRSLPRMPRPIELDPGSSSVLLSFPNNYLGSLNSSGATRKGTAIVLDRETLSPKSRAMTHDELIADARFLPHGLWIFSGAEDGRLKLWDAASGAPITFNGRHRDRVSSIDIASHGLLVASGAKDGTARIWNALEDGIHSEILMHPSAVSVVRFDPTATRLATGTEAGTVTIWDLTPHRVFPVRLDAGSPGTATALSADGTRLAVHSQDGMVRLWNATAGQLLTQVTAPKWASLHIADSAGTLVIENEQRFRLVHLADGSAVSDWIELGSEIIQTSLDPKRDRFLTATQAGQIDLWDLKTGKHVGGPLSHRTAVNSAIFTLDGNVVAAAGRTMILWDPISGRQLATGENRTPALTKMIDSGERPPNEIIDLRVTSDGARILALYGWNGSRADFVNIRRHFVPEQAALWSSKLEPIGELEAGDANLNVISLSPDAAMIATAYRSNVVRVWSTVAGKQLGEPLRHSFFVKQLDFSADSDRLIVSGKPDRVAIWRGWTPDARPITLRTDGPAARVIVDSPAGTVATLSTSGVLELWDAETGRPIAAKLNAAEDAELLSADAIGETFAVTDKAGRSSVWTFRLPTTDAARCALAKTGERAGGFGLNDSDVAVPLGSLTNRGRVFAQKCPGGVSTSVSTDVSSDVSSGPVDAWLSLPGDRRTIAPGSPITMHRYLRDVLKSDPDSQIAIKLMLEDPSDPCLRSALAKTLMNAGDRDHLSEIGKFLIRQSGLRGALGACE